ncbi:MAG: hypothetical protein AAFY41_03335 [Bacteroidota bacterium]
MKFIRFFFLLCLISLFSCNDEEEQPDTITTVLQRIINENEVTALQHCCIECECFQSIGLGSDYEFIGESTVRIRTNFYDLNTLVRYEISDLESEIRMILYFDN